MTMSKAQFQQMSFEFKEFQLCISDYRMESARELQHCSANTDLRLPIRFSYKSVVDSGERLP